MNKSESSAKKLFFSEDTVCINVSKRTNANKIIGAGLNIYNSVSANFFNLPCITAESDISTRINSPYMTLRHCPIKQNLKTDCKNCKYNTNYKFKMENGKILTLKRKKLSTCTFYLT